MNATFELPAKDLTKEMPAAFSHGKTCISFKKLPKLAQQPAATYSPFYFARSLCGSLSGPA